MSCFFRFVFAVITSLVYFIDMFKKAHNQNKLWEDARKKKSLVAIVEEEIGNIS